MSSVSTQSPPIDSAHACCALTDMHEVWFCDLAGVHVAHGPNLRAHESEPHTHEWCAPEVVDEEWVAQCLHEARDQLTAPHVVAPQGGLTRVVHTNQNPLHDQHHQTATNTS